MDIIDILSLAVKYLIQDDALTLRLVCKKCTFVNNYNYMQDCFFIYKDINKLCDIDTERYSEFFYTVIDRWGYNLFLDNYNYILTFNKHKLFNKIKHIELRSEIAHNGFHFYSPNKHIVCDISFLNCISSISLYDMKIDTCNSRLDDLYFLTINYCEVLGGFSFLKYCTKLQELRLLNVDVDIIPSLPELIYFELDKCSNNIILEKCVKLNYLLISNIKIIIEFHPICSTRLDLVASKIYGTDALNKLHNYDLSKASTLNIEAIKKCSPLIEIGFEDALLIVDISSAQWPIKLNELELSGAKILSTK